MYTDEDLYSAVQEGIFEETAVDRFRQFMEKTNNVLAVDEENFKLISGFNDIFVVIASLVLLGSVGWLVSKVDPALGLFSAAVLSWFLSIVFVVQRRLALPAILFLGVFVGTSSAFAFVVLGKLDVQLKFMLPSAAAFALAMTGLHWYKFRVPITVAYGMACGMAFVISLLLSMFPSLLEFINIILLVCGMGTFALAMYWDAQDTERKTRKSDTAFWLHLLAAPLLVHPIFAMLGVLEGQATLWHMTFVVALYLLLGLVSIIVDRRAMMVSALGYVIYAIAQLFKQSGTVDYGFAISGALIGALLLFLSAAWAPIRAKLLLQLSDGVRLFVPPVK